MRNHRPVVEPLSIMNAPQAGGFMPPASGVSSAKSQEMLHKIGKVQAWANVYQIVDSVLSGNVVEVKAGVFPPFQASTLSFTDGKVIYLNSEALAVVNDEMILSMTGVNYHELAHVMFTPRNNSEIVKFCTDNNFLQAFNLLEDNRIELLLGTMFPSMQVSLTKSVLNYLLEQQVNVSVNVGKFQLNTDSDNAKHLYHLLHGRKYLPVQLRKAYAGLFVAEYGIDFTTTICNIIDRYNKIVYPANTAEAKLLITDFADLLGLLPDTTATHATGGFSDSESMSAESSDSDSMDQSWANNLINEFESLVDNSSNEIQPNKSANEDLLRGNCINRATMTKGRTATPTQQAQLQEQADEAFDDYQPADSINSDGTPNADGTPSSASKDGEQESGMSADELEELLDSLNQQIMQTEQAHKDIKKVKDVVADSQAQAENLPEIKSVATPVDREYRLMAEQFGKELEQLVRLNDPYWNYEQPTGRLNVGRAMRATPDQVDSLFDRWETGSDAYDIEAVVLLDNSGSMQRQIDMANQTAWTIKRGLEAIDGLVTVLTFSDYGKTLYASHETTTPVHFRKIEVEGNTNPEQALRETELIMRNSNRNTKLVFVVSDGEWDNQRCCEDIIDRLNSIDNVMTNAVFLLDRRYAGYGNHDTERLRHRCHTLTVIKEPKGILDVAKSVMRNLSRVEVK